jgi:hypothetical protein
MPAAKDRIVRKHIDWFAEGTRLFGPNLRNWRFRCPRCGGVQTGQDFVDAGLTPEQAATRAYFSCIGRVVRGRGCDWSLGGLLRIHEVEVLDPTDGSTVPVFDFDRPQAPEFGASPA